MRQYFADLHIHVGISESGQWIKIPTSRRLTIGNILAEAADRKGLDIVGIVDALSPLVLADLTKLVEMGHLRLLSGGGYRYQEKITLILGAEIETTETAGGMAHTLVYLPDIPTMQQFSEYMSQFIRNISLSSQNAHMSLQKLLQIAVGFNAVVIPAHVFTPHKSVYGVCCQRLSAILSEKEMSYITAIELGLSADTMMADRIAELSGYTFLTNSDAHSPGKIAREYNILSLAAPDFKEWMHALKSFAGRSVVANYGLDPRLGKYHHTLCLSCGYIGQEAEKLLGSCPTCGSSKLVNGVSGRINEIADFATPIHPVQRAPYFYQIPLEFIPGLGKKSLEKLLAVFGTEMNVIHHAQQSQLTEVVGTVLADQIIQARSGLAAIVTGGGGVYGKILKS
jgi:uncharacterized protein (TIGR00375 family)